MKKNISSSKTKSFSLMTILSIVPALELIFNISTTLGLGIFVKVLAFLCFPAIVIIITFWYFKIKEENKAIIEKVDAENKLINDFMKIMTANFVDQRVAYTPPQEPPNKIKERYMRIKEEWIEEAYISQIMGKSMNRKDIEKALEEPFNIGKN